ncbi:helix-turn-helix domain-containing protein [Streptomyces europaeiscabiei]|uniref:AraC-like ligand-binding domain-containing protein n=1 Tax=Streptomyces europaeiscabiei TaxID=146819 RepID=UPI0029B57E3E|nr:helix-turn-helix domain-containing protein [Streptomyces europaeiscabiei]MDX3697405.1 helix-turn-helix domain-containing protein [Streptomyces europaeiscabiei]
MVAFVLSTDSVPPDDRLSYWHDAVQRTFVPLDVTTPRNTPFSGSVATEGLGQLRISTVNADRELVRRTKRLIAESPDEYMLLGLQTRGSGVVVQDERTAVLSPGQLALYDTTRPYTLDFPGRFETVVFQMPRRALGIPESDLRRITGVTIAPDQGLAGMVVPLLSKVATEAGIYRPEIGEMLARNITDLLATLVTECLGRGTASLDAARQTLLLRIRAFIDARLADPALSAEAVAAAHHISVRHLQRLFQAEGTTVSEWIRRRRLEACRRELGRPRRTRPAVAAVAQRWGFVSPAHFSRAFRAFYGMSPREWQTLAEGTGS